MSAHSIQFAEPLLSIEEIEIRLLAAAKRHHLEERNIAYWLLEIGEQGLHKQRGFSSIGDYAMELVGMKPRKAQYLVFIASRLRKLPRIREAFDSGTLSWTKAREIAGVATRETEAEWLEKTRVLSNRDLEREVRRHAGQDSGGFATVTISMPVEVLEMWNDAFELAERISGTDLEKWQVLEPSLAEFLGTHLPIATHGGSVEVDDEKDLDESVRHAVLERDGWRCLFPGCTMRKMLDVHHIVFRSRGGTDEIGGLICLCRIHHDLIHRGICNVTGTVGVDLKFERPQLASEKAAPPPSSESKTRAAATTKATTTRANKSETSYEDRGLLAHCVEPTRVNAREDGARRRPVRGGSRAHVCAETESSKRSVENADRPDARVVGGRPERLNGRVQSAHAVVAPEGSWASHVVSLLR